MIVFVVSNSVTLLVNKDVLGIVFTADMALFRSLLVTARGKSLPVADCLHPRV